MGQLEIAQLIAWERRQELEPEQAAHVTMLPAAVDAWMMDLFPGRFLEEIDEVDWVRLMKAVQAKNISAIEKLRVSLAKSGAKEGSLSVDVVEAIQEHERIHAEWLTSLTS